MLLRRHSIEQVIIFTRYPEAGKVKTRLIHKLGAAGAARLQRHLTEQIIRQVRPVTRQRPARLVLHYTGGSRRRMREWLGSSLPLAKQRGRNIGHRMLAAFQAAWQEGAVRAVLIGSDCPALDGPLIAEALERLLTHDLVLGPSRDGGYYLIGLHGGLAPVTQESLFSDINWGTAAVLGQTLDRAMEAGLSSYTLQPLHDIDRAQDLEHFHHHPHSQ